MNYVVLHQSKYRLRLHLPHVRMSDEQADLMEYYLQSQSWIVSASVNEQTCNATLRFAHEFNRWEELDKIFEKFSYKDESIQALVPEHTSRQMNRMYQNKLLFLVLGKAFRKVFLPIPLQMAWTICSSAKFIKEGLACLCRGQIKVPVLDATAILASMLRKDFTTAGSIMFLLNVGDTLEEWTHRKSVDDLARTLSLQVDKVWRKDGSQEELVEVSECKKGDLIVVRTSNIIPLDGKVVEGTVSVNQASMTGEAVPVMKEVGGYVYAGTVVEQGNCVIEVTKEAGTGKYDQIVTMIEESEKLKSQTEDRAFHLADRLVPYSLVGSALTWLLTRNINRAMAFLMVDFSCALKLSMPLSVLSAIREAGSYEISVKGGKYLEAIAEADTIVFDKTGTLTHAQPQVMDIVTFSDMDQIEALRVAACLEEHYPHSIANAVVNEAKKQNIAHEEMHSKVEYVIAHGISSQINGKKAIIGSYHFVFEDEACQIPEGKEAEVENLPAEYSHLFLAIDGVLQAAICIFDPLREEASQVISTLKKMGMHVCMMTGDNEKTAARIAELLDLDEYYSEVLPEQKAEFVAKCHEKGHKVIMIGDGVNDAPALSESDCGIAISDGAAIAREIADVTISADSLWQVVRLNEISRALMKRISSNYRFIVSFNSALITLGVAGIITPSSSALLHNGSTIISGLRSMTNVLPEEENKRNAIAF